MSKMKLIVAISELACISNEAARNALDGFEDVVVFSGHPLGNIGEIPPMLNHYDEQVDCRFNAQPERSTFTPKIHNRSKRW